MPKSDLPFDGDYAPVAERVTLFYERYPKGRIVTRLVSQGERAVIFKAMVFRGADDVRPAATGWASERPGDGEVNAVACVENTETSAIGRALANLGFTASPNRPSREEMQQAVRARERLARTERRGPSRRTPAVREGHALIGGEELQLRANAAHDALALVEQAEAVGLSSERAERLRARLLDRGITLADAERLERLLRGWIARRRARLLAPPEASGPADGGA